MSDAEGIRNLVGTGLVQLVGGFVTAAMGLGVLLWLNWHLTLITCSCSRSSAAAWRTRSTRCAALPRARQDQRRGDGRLTEALGGIRIVKSYTAEKREEIVFTKGAHKLFRNIAQSMTGVSATSAGAPPSSASWAC
jgi:subfamily B ATP-binding cassette protein MsbA